MAAYLSSSSSSSSATGVVIRFYDHKGYGFIKPDSSVSDDKDLFVHRSEIQSEGYRSLQEGQKVNYLVAVKKDRKQAVNVTVCGRNGSRDGVRGSGFRGNGNDVRGSGFRGNGNDVRGSGFRGNGNDVRGSGFRGNGNDVRGSGFRGNGNGNGVGFRCYGNGSCCDFCGGIGHVARDCTSEGICVAPGGFSNAECDQCGEEGHLDMDCHLQCVNCGEKGHLGDSCGGLNADGTGRVTPVPARAGWYKSGGGDPCYNCLQVGHFPQVCPQKLRWKETN